MIPAIYQDAGEFHEGLAWVVLESTPERNTFGYIDRTGNLVITGDFYHAHDFSHGLAAVRIKTEQGHKYGFINRHGEMAIAPQFDVVLPGG